MPVVQDSNLSLALKNVALFGDTDVLPYPPENLWFYDKRNDLKSLLLEIDKHFDAILSEYPIVLTKTLAAVGYTGFRAVAQIDPIWNAYLLALTIEIGEDIERTRSKVPMDTVYSYRFSLDFERSSLFSPSFGWQQFQKQALMRTVQYSIVVSTDISDFYPRIYHHRLENALVDATNNAEAIARIMKMLQKLSSNASYGLPVGGNAARLLAEIVLHQADMYLVCHNISFIRFVDDCVPGRHQRREGVELCSRWG